MSPLTSSLSAAYMGVLVSAVLYGITTLQTYYYFHNYRQDRKFLLYMVACLWILDTLQFLFAAHGAYIYLVSNFGNYIAILSPTWSVLANMYITAFSDSAIRIFFGWRVMKLCDCRRTLGKTLFFAIMCLSLVSFTSMIVTTSRAFVVKTYDKLENEVSNLVWIAMCAAVTGDILVATSLCSSVAKMRSGTKECDSVIKFLLTFFINTGLLTCLTTIAGLITFITMPHTCIWIALFFSLGKLYTNSLLASLNARKLYRDDFEGSLKEEQHVSFPTMHFRNVEDTSEE